MHVVCRGKTIDLERVQKYGPTLAGFLKFTLYSWKRQIFWEKLCGAPREYETIVFRDIDAYVACGKIEAALKEGRCRVYL